MPNCVRSSSSRPTTKDIAIWSPCSETGPNGYRIYERQGEGMDSAWPLYPVRLAEIPPHERAPILKAWCQVATSGRQHLPVSPHEPVSAFETIAGDYPVFRIDSAR